MMADCVICGIRITSNLKGDQWWHLEGDDRDHEAIPRSERNRKGDLPAPGSAEARTRLRIAEARALQMAHQARIDKRERDHRDAIERGSARRQAAIERGKQRRYH